MNSSPMDAYSVEPYPIHTLLQTDAKTDANAGYDHWTFERLDNSNATSWEDSSPMRAYGFPSFVQTDSKVNSGYDHWTDERFDNSNETTWVNSSPMAAYGA